MQTEQKPSCTACRYTDGQTGGSLTCQRYPQPHRVARSYWCGEFKPLVEAQPVEAKPAEVKTSRPRARGSSWRPTSRAVPRLRSMPRAC